MCMVIEFKVEKNVALIPLWGGKTITTFVVESKEQPRLTISDYVN